MHILIQKLNVLKFLLEKLRILKKCLMFKNDYKLQNTGKSTAKTLKCRTKTRIKYRMSKTVREKLAKMFRILKKNPPLPM